MRNISIVYKRSNTFEEIDNKRKGQLDMRRTVHNYCTTAIEKNKNKQEVIQKVRIQTAKITKVINRNGVISSLNIIPISSPQPPPMSRNLTQRKLPKPKTNIFNIKKSIKNDYISLKLPSHDEQKQDPFIFRKSIKQLSKHSRMKLLTKIRCQKQVTLILSIDFIYNEFNFWGEEEIEENCLKIWKVLLSLANIIWIVRSQSAYRKLNYFVQNKGLRLDGVMQIEPNKRQSLTISYASLEEEAKYKRNHKILIVNCLRNDCYNEIKEYEIRNNLPIISHPQTFVHFALIDMKDKKRMMIVKKIVSEDLPKPFKLHQILEQYREKKGKINNLIRWKQNYQYQIEQSDYLDPQQQIQRIKQNFLTHFEQSFGLKTKLQGGDSLNYVIGDMLKRNLSIIKQYLEYCQQSQSQTYKKQISKQDNEINRRMKKLEYNRPVYMWQS